MSVQESSVARHFAAYGAGAVSGLASWVLGFGLLATWNGALDHFESRHLVLSIVLGVSTLFIGAGAAFVGARALVAPDHTIGQYELDSMGNRIRVGALSTVTSKSRAAVVLFGGWLWNVGVGAIFYFGGQ